MFKIECPQCHHLFSVREEGEELIGDEEETGFKEDRKEKLEDALEFLNPLDRFKAPGNQYVPGEFGKDTPEEGLTYEYKFKCKHCGDEFSVLKEKERKPAD